MAKRGINLYVNCGSDYSIVDEDRKVYSVEEARKIWDSNRVGDFNLAMSRLALLGWDIEKLKASYAT